MKDISTLKFKKKKKKTGELKKVIQEKHLKNCELRLAPAEMVSLILSHRLSKYIPNATISDIKGHFDIGFCLTLDIIH